FTDQDWLAPVKVTLAPFSCMLMLVALAFSLSPSGENPVALYTASAVGGVFAVLASYLSLSYCLVAMSPKRWHELGLDPYREARLDSLVAKSPRWIARLLRPQNGLLLLVLAFFVWQLNIIRAENTPPTFHIAIASIEV